MVKAWNEKMKRVFLVGWITYLDESLSIWTNGLTCPDYVFCQRKLYPFGDEYHTITCGICVICFGSDMVEGKDRPSELPTDPKTQKKCPPSSLSLQDFIWHREYCDP